jgi:ABC-type Fe3+ transport system substrate-binding protein
LKLFRFLFLLLAHLIFGTELCAEENKELIILSPHWEGIRHEYTQAFKKSLQHEITIRWIDVGGTSDILRYIETSYNESSTLKADILFGGGTFPFAILAKKNLLENPLLSDEYTRNIPSKLGSITLIDSEQKWFSAMFSTFGILCNREVLKRLQLPSPKTWSDLADPRYHSWIGAADPRKSGSAHVVYEIILQAYGWEKGWNILQGIASNVRSFSAGSSELPHAVLVGEVACTMLIDSYAAHSMSQIGGDVLSFQVPEGLSTFSGDAIALLKGSRNSTLAKKFIEFVLSKEGQKLLALEPGSLGGPDQFRLRRLSVLPELYQDKETAQGFLLNPFDRSRQFLLDEKEVSTRWDLLNDLVGTFLIEAPKTKNTPAIPLTYEDSKKLASEWSNSQIRLASITTWKQNLPSDNRSLTWVEMIGISFYLLLLFVSTKITRRFSSLRRYISRNS